MNARPKSRPIWFAARLRARRRRLAELQRARSRRRSIEMPYSSVPEAIAPSTKYFIADSAAMPESRSNATIAYSDSDSSSTPRYTVSRLSGRDHHHHAEQREQPEHEVLAPAGAALLQVLARVQERDRDRAVREQLEHVAHRVRDEHAVERRHVRSSTP